MAKNRKSKTRFYEDDVRAFIFTKKKTANTANPFTGEIIENHPGGHGKKGGALRTSKDRIEARLDSFPSRRKAYAKIEKTYDEDTNLAAKTYSGEEGYIAINGHLRAGGDLGTFQNANLHKLQRAASGDLAEPTMVYRGVSDRIGDMILANKEYEAKGFTSTSTDPRYAGSFGNTVLEIRATKGATISSTSKFPEEMEIVQAHGAKYRVQGVEKSQTFSRITGGKKNPHRVTKRVIVLEQI